MPKKSKRRNKPTPDLPAMEGPGVAPVRNPTLERLAVDWLDLKAKEDDLKAEVKTALESLIAQMRASETYIYKWDGHRIELTTKDKITCKDVDDPVEE